MDPQTYRVHSFLADCRSNTLGNLSLSHKRRDAELNDLDYQIPDSHPRKLMNWT